MRALQLLLVPHIPAPDHAALWELSACEGGFAAWGLVGNQNNIVLEIALAKT